MTPQPISAAAEKAGYVDAEIENMFSYHSPKEGQADIYQEIRETAKELAYKIRRECPGGENQDRAIARLRESVMWANSAIACS